MPSLDGKYQVVPLTYSKAVCLLRNLVSLKKKRSAETSRRNFGSSSDRRVLLIPQFPSRSVLDGFVDGFGYVQLITFFSSLSLFFNCLDGRSCETFEPTLRVLSNRNYLLFCFLLSVLFSRGISCRHLNIKSETSNKCLISLYSPFMSEKAKSKSKVAIS